MTHQNRLKLECPIELQRDLQQVCADYNGSIGLSHFRFSLFSPSGPNKQKLFLELLLVILLLMLLLLLFCRVQQAVTLYYPIHFGLPIKTSNTKLTCYSSIYLYCNPVGHLQNRKYLTLK